MVLYEFKELGEKMSVGQVQWVFRMLGFGN